MDLSCSRLITRTTHLTTFLKKHSNKGTLKITKEFSDIVRSQCNPIKSTCREISLDFNVKAGIKETRIIGQSLSRPTLFNCTQIL